MQNTSENNIKKAEEILIGFANRSGIAGDSGDADRRYLWTDAFAVQCLFGLYRLSSDKEYKNMALKLIDEVHDKLGKFHPKDERDGWISGLDEAEGQKHPTINGLRIGKNLRERKPEEAYDQQLEWERDGQYFHYLTRWINTLFQTEFQTEDQKFGKWAGELCLAGEKFISKSQGRLHMHWKMSTDLSRPLIPSMGAHDPLEGLICTFTTKEKCPNLFEGNEALLADFTKLCAKSNWTTSDSLGLGGLFLNVVRAAELEQKMELPESIKANTLLQNAYDGLHIFVNGLRPENPAFRRLAFRECGLSLGLRVLWEQKQKLSDWGVDISALEEFMPLADEIESFWSLNENQSAHTWIDHQDINEISLASSLIAKSYPQVFANLEGHPNF